ncbi:unnamed protein product [Vitrella brassicaformis CCMP3155]|uniref:Poly [ADP-ribose] polymerase n=4 Tax=Vitrella brassicaformis TaxID=1169539 RepID=A0A0G4EAA9_VITBC|nr:unnamed protein product [Vitrella brassicaformis CCMP3155]|eukprot:CEL92888.1 unnamed protein product [Vitrella brassicaformis CCMP3155]
MSEIFHLVLVAPLLLIHPRPASCQSKIDLTVTPSPLSTSPAGSCIEVGLSVSIDDLFIGVFQLQAPSGFVFPNGMDRGSSATSECLCFVSDYPAFDVTCQSNTLSIYHDQNDPSYVPLTSFAARVCVQNPRTPLIRPSTQDRFQAVLAPDYERLDLITARGTVPAWSVYPSVERTSAQRTVGSALSAKLSIAFCPDNVAEVEVIAPSFDLSAAQLKSGTVDTTISVLSRGTDALRLSLTPVVPYLVPVVILMEGLTHPSAPMRQSVWTVRAYGGANQGEVGGVTDTEAFPVLALLDTRIVARSDGRYAALANTVTFEVTSSHDIGAHEWLAVASPSGYKIDAASFTPLAGFPAGSGSCAGIFDTDLCSDTTILTQTKGALPANTSARFRLTVQNPAFAAKGSAPLWLIETRSSAFEDLTTNDRALTDPPLIGMLLDTVIMGNSTAPETSSTVTVVFRLSHPIYLPQAAVETHGVALRVTLTPPPGVAPSREASLGLPSSHYEYSVDEDCRAAGEGPPAEDLLRLANDLSNEGASLPPSVTSLAVSSCAAEHTEQDNSAAISFVPFSVDLPPLAGDSTSGLYPVLGTSSWRSFSFQITNPRRLSGGRRWRLTVEAMSSGAWQLTHQSADVSSPLADVGQLPVLVDSSTPIVGEESAVSIFWRPTVSATRPPSRRLSGGSGHTGRLGKRRRAQNGADDVTAVFILLCPEGVTTCRFASRQACINADPPQQLSAPSALVPTPRPMPLYRCTTEAIGGTIVLKGLTQSLAALTNGQVYVIHVDVRQPSAANTAGWTMELYNSDGQSATDVSSIMLSSQLVAATFSAQGYSLLSSDQEMLPITVVPTSRATSTSTKASITFDITRAVPVSLPSSITLRPPIAVQIDCSEPISLSLPTGLPLTTWPPSSTCQPDAIGSTVLTVTLDPSQGLAEGRYGLLVSVSHPSAGLSAGVGTGWRVEVVVRGQLYGMGIKDSYETSEDEPTWDQDLDGISRGAAFGDCEAVALKVASADPSVQLASSIVTEGTTAGFITLGQVGGDYRRAAPDIEGKPQWTHKDRAAVRIEWTYSYTGVWRVIVSGSGSVARQTALWTPLDTSLPPLGPVWRNVHGQLVILSGKCAESSKSGNNVVLLVIYASVPTTVLLVIGVLVRLWFIRRRKQRWIRKIYTTHDTSGATTHREQKERKYLRLPSYWETNPLKDRPGQADVPGRTLTSDTSARDAKAKAHLQSERFELGDRERRLVQHLMNETFLDRRTRDREGRMPKWLKVTSVHRIENPRLWTEYCVKRYEMLREVRTLEDELYKMSNIRTMAAWQHVNPSTTHSLVPEVNETYLFHGTSMEAAEAIADSGFMIKLAGTGAGTLYGKGIYFTECSSKGDEYTSTTAAPATSTDRDTTSAATANEADPPVYSMLLCRVCLGHIFWTPEDRPTPMQLYKLVKGGPHHSVLGDRETAKGTYREFIVYEPDQAYPEYLIRYCRRAHPKKSERRKRRPKGKTHKQADMAEGEPRHSDEAIASEEEMSPVAAGGGGRAGEARRRRSEEADNNETDVSSDDTLTDGQDRDGGRVG